MFFRNRQNVKVVAYVQYPSTSASESRFFKDLVVDSDIFQFFNFPQLYSKNLKRDYQDLKNYNPKKV